MTEPQIPTYQATIYIADDLAVTRVLLPGAYS